MEQEEEVQIKVEDEMGIFVKEEESLIGVGSTSDYNEDASIDLADLLVEPRHQFVRHELCQKELFVYTKKLDDMNVWKNLHIYKYSKDILKMVIAESKPTFTKIYKKKKKRKYMVKFNKFISNLQMYKDKIAVEDRRKQRTNIKNSKADVNNEKKKQYIIQTINIDDDSDVISAHDTSDTSEITTDDEETDIISTVAVHPNIAPITSNIAGDPQTSTGLLTTTGNIVIIHTLRSLYDVYFVNNSGIPTGFYRLDQDNLRSIIHMKIKMHVNNCCWYKRDMRLKYMMMENRNSTLYTFMRRPHGCDSGNCTCCCKRKYDYDNQFTSSKTIQRTVKSHVQNRWHQRLISLRAQQYQNSLINAALVHKPKIKSNNEKEQKKQYFSNICFKLQCKNKLMHAYYIGENGLISTYIRPNPFCTLLAAYFKDMIGFWFSSATDKNICCLTEYKKYCLQLIKRAHPTVVKFLINNLINEPNKCDTCENMEIQNAVKGVVVPLYLPKYPRHTKPNSKVMIRTLNIVDLKKNMQPQQYTILSTVIEKPINESMNSSLPKTTTQNLRAQNNTKTPVASKINKITAINSINLGIKNLRLVIFPGGKVKIMSKTSPDDFSTEKLKILREIIQHAQNKVISQGFNPTQLIKVNNLFTEDPPTPKIQEKQPEVKEAVTHMQCTVLSSAEKVQNQQLNVSKNIQSNKVIDKIINCYTQPVPKSIVIVKENQSHLIRQDKNVYQLLRNISGEKRKQYLISHEFLRTAGTNLWAHVNVIENEKVGDNIVDNIVYNTKESTKRKASEKETSPPPKQLRKGSLQNTISIVPMASSNTTFLPTTSSNIFTETIRQPQTTASLQPLLQTIPTESLQQLQVPNVSFSLPNNVTVIPIAQLPQEFVASLYKKYAFLPENTQTQPQNVQAQPVIPMNVTEHILPTTSLLDNSNLRPLVSSPNSLLMSSDVPRIPVVQNTQAENIENDDTDTTNDFCILGI